MIKFFKKLYRVLWADGIEVNKKAIWLFNNSDHILKNIK